MPVICAEQMLDWLEGRNNTSFAGLSFDGSRLRFSLSQAAGARGLEAMVPAAWAAGRLSGLTRNGAPVATSSRMVKGIEYLVFAAEPGDYVATYPPASAPAPPGGGPTPPAGGPQDELAPRVRVRPRRVRASRGGLVKLRVSCPRERAPLPRRSPAAPRRHHCGTQEVPRGRRQDPARLAAPASGLHGGRCRGSSAMRVMAVAAARDAAGNRGTTRTRIRLLAPRRR